MGTMFAFFQRDGRSFDCQILLNSLVMAEIASVGWSIPVSYKPNLQDNGGLLNLKVGLYVKVIIRQ